MGRNRYKIFENEQPHFLTWTTINRLALFSNPHVANIVFDSLNFLQLNSRIHLYAYVLMENHLHIIGSSPQLSKEIANFKSFTARQIINFFKSINASSILKQLEFYKKKHKQDRQYQFWQEGSHPQAIETEHMMLQKIEYIHNNPVMKGYVNEPSHWRYSSAINYSGQQGFVDIVPFDL